MITSSYIIKMRDQVCVILNERESTKHAAVASLLDLLKKSSITASRIEISEKIIELACLRCPEILVLDYLLGDYSTGLDIVYAINKLPQEKRPVIFFLTDEPSVQVAVEAMQLGVKNYFQLERKDSLPKLAQEIVNTLQSKRQPKPLLRKDFPVLDALIAQSPSSHAMISQARAFIKKDSKHLFIWGEQGSGKTILAECLHNELGKNKVIQNFDLKYFDGDVRLLGCIKEGISCTVENAEDDNGEVLEYLSKCIKSNNPEENGRLIVTSRDKSTLQAWKKILPFDVLEIPALKSRREDIAAMVQSFIHITEAATGCKLKKINPENISAVCGMDWPGNVSQLKSVIIDSVIESVYSEQDLLELISSKKEKWLEYNSAGSNTQIDSFTAAATLEMSNQNFRIAAAKLGCSIKELHTAVCGNN